MKKFYHKIKNNVFPKGYVKYALFAALAVFAAAMLGSVKSSPAKAQTSNWAVPEFGANIGDYSSCLNGYVEDNGAPGNAVSGNWTPMGGGIQNGVSGMSSFQAGDCIQAGMATDTSNQYTEDFRVGIRVSPSGHGVATRSGSGSTVGTNCANWGNWQYTAWASSGGGTSALASSPTSTNIDDSWGLECVQLQVQTQPLPAGVTTISNPHFGIDISHAGNPGGNNGYDVESYTSKACYLDAYWRGNDDNPPTPSCLVENLGGGGNFWSADVTMTADSVGAIETSNNVPTTFNASAATTTDSDGSSLSITMKNIGTAPWAPTFTSVDKDGTQSGNCTFAYDSSNGVLNAPRSGSKTSSCSVTTDLTSTDYFLVHTASKFSISPEKIPISYTGVTKTITYTPAHTVTLQIPCGGAIKNDNNSIFAFIKTAFAVTSCIDTRDIPESWNVSYSVAVSITPGQNFVFPMTSMTAPAATGIYNETWQMQNGGNAFGTPFTIAITVGTSTPPRSETGTLNVSSTNIVTGGPVVGSWSAVGPTTESSTNAASASYTNLPLPGGVANYTVHPNIAQGYALGTVKTQNIAQANNRENVLTKTFAAIHNAFTSVAFADSDLVNAEVCMPSDYSLSTSTGIYVCANGQGQDDSQTLTTATPTAESIIMWYPLATMGASSSSVAVDSGSGQIAVQNTGAPGSELDWTANTTSTWFSLSSGSGSVVNNASQEGSTGATQNITITADASKLSSGSYTGTVHITGTTKYCSATTQGCTYTILEPITFTGGTCTGSGCTGCSNANDCTPIIGNKSPSIRISPSSNTITLGQSQKLTISSTNADSCTASGDWSGTEPCNGTVTVTPNASGTFNYDIKAINSYGSASDSSVIIVQDSNGCPGSGCTSPSNSEPSCTLKASPASVVVPGSSTLTYSCVNVSSCSMSGGGFGTSSIVSVSGTTAKGTTTDAPTTNTFYTITCDGTGSYSSATATANVQVIVTNPGRSETSTF